MGSEWSEVRLGDACTKIGSGATPRGGKSTYTAVGPFSLVRSQNVLNNEFKWAGLAHISDEQAAALNNVALKPGDILLNITGNSVARCCQVDPRALPGRVNQHVAIIRPDNQKLHPGYLRYYLTSPGMQAHMLTLAGSGATRDAITKAMIESFEIPKPPLSEQRRIASILGALDDKIELNRRMSQTLDEMAQAIFKSWFVDFDRHSCVEPATGLPAGWSRRPIGDIVRVEGGTTPSTKRDEYWLGGVHQFGTPKDMSGLNVPVLLQTEKQVTDAGLATIGSGLLPAGTVLMSSRAPIGYLAIAEEPIAVNQGIIAMVCQSALSAEFILGWARHSQAEIASRANGSTFMEISKGNFRQIPVVVPDSRSLADFDKIAKPLHRRMVACEIQARKLSALRDALLPRLLSGDIAVHQAMAING